MPAGRLAMMAFAVALLAGCSSAPVREDRNGMDIGAAVARQSDGRRQEQAAVALREMLQLAASRATTTLAKPGGYLKNPRLRIGLPASLQASAAALRAAGGGALVTALEDDMNVAAEIAARNTLPMFRQAIAGLAIQDAQVIVQGDDSAATRHLRDQTEAELLALYVPLLVDAMRKTGLQDSYRALIAQVGRSAPAEMPVVDIELHLRSAAIDGLFLQIGAEEKALRAAQGW